MFLVLGLRLIKKGGGSPFFCAYMFRVYTLLVRKQKFEQT